MTFNHLISKENLTLAWRRINTGLNHSYKNYHRGLYYSYEIALKRNIQDLHSRLRGGSFKTSLPVQIFIPKPSGLHRRITLLSIEDQIVLQAIANVFEEKLGKRRKDLQFKSIFSNIQNKKNRDIFFLQDWHESYSKFQKKMEQYFDRKYRWVAFFDLAAYYDTISHDLLLSTLFPKKGNQVFQDKLKTWLQGWSSERPLATFRHGIAQGPIASDYLAECLLLEIDERMSAKYHYIRYVDDIRLFGKSEDDVRKAVIELEILCHKKGLIPQGNKFEIKELKNLDEALNILPSLAAPDREDGVQSEKVLKSTAIKLFKKSLDGRPQKIVNKTYAKYVLYKAGPSFELLNYVLKLLPKHPEYIDAFSVYLSRYRRNERIIEACKTYLLSTPYGYVRGHLWHILARMVPIKQMKKFITLAVETLKDKGADFSSKYGACQFLCRIEALNIGAYSKFVMYQDTLMQSMLVPYIPEKRFVAHDDVITRLLKRTSYEPALMLADPLVHHKLVAANFLSDLKSLPSQVKNVYESIGLAPTTSRQLDPMGEILSNRYGIKKSTKWTKLFGVDYVHALQSLQQGDPVYDSGRSLWLSYQNAFNHDLFIAVQRQLHTHSMDGAMTLVGSDGKNVKYGSLLDPLKVFSKKYPNIAIAFRSSNDRRNTLPIQHPVTEKDNKRTKYLKKSEQTVLFGKAKIAYEEIAALLDIFFP